MKYNIYFDPNNYDCILVKLDNKLINMIECPQCERGCDIINFDGKLNDGYTYNFDDLVLITTPTERKIYHKGYFIAHCKR